MTPVKDLLRPSSARLVAVRSRLFLYNFFPQNPQRRIMRDFHKGKLVVVRDAILEHGSFLYFRFSHELENELVVSVIQS